MKEPLTRTLSDGKSWRLEEDYIITLPDGRTIFIPTTFVFDYASIPRIAWRLFPPATGKHRIPALPHDWLCATGHVTWEDAANIFNYLMTQADVPMWKRFVIYWAVRAYGPFHKPDPRQDRLRELQRVALMEHDAIFKNVI